MYYNGQGVTKNLMAAYAWFTIAAANGYTNVAKPKATTAKQLTPANSPKPRHWSRI